MMKMETDKIMDETNSNAQPVSSFRMSLCVAFLKHFTAVVCVQI